MGAVAYHQNRGAAFARYAHPALTTAVALVALALFFGTEGEVRRGIWEWFGPLLGANGIASFFGIPALLAITWWWKRSPPVPFECIDFDERSGDIVVRVEPGTFHRIARERIEAVETEATRDGMRRIAITMRGRGIQDRYVLLLSPELAEQVLAFIGPRPGIFDLGPRRTDAAFWSSTLSYVATCATAMLGSMIVRHNVPLAVFEPWAASESLGWAVGLGAAAFGPTFAALSLWTRPPTVRIGVDGMSIVRGRDVRFLPWTGIASVNAGTRGVEIVMTAGRHERISLVAVPAPRIAELVRLVRARADAARDAAVVAPSEIAEAAPNGAAYRSRAIDAQRLEADLIAPSSSGARRLRVARVLADEGAPGRAALRVAALGIADPGVRCELERMSVDEDVAEGEVGMTESPRRRARLRD